jgi:hypothetical protein
MRSDTNGDYLSKNHRHPGEALDPAVCIQGFVPWIPACADEMKSEMSTHEFS